MASIDSRAPQRPSARYLGGLKVAIVGSGVAGLVTARALLDAGADVTVYERRPLEEALTGAAAGGAAPPDAGVPTNAFCSQPPPICTLAPSSLPPRAGPAGLGMQRNAMRAMRLLSGAADDASLAHDVAAVGVADAVVVMMDSSGRFLSLTQFVLA